MVKTEIFLLHKQLELFKNQEILCKPPKCFRPRKPKKPLLDDSGQLSFDFMQEMRKVVK